MRPFVVVLAFYLISICGIQSQSFTYRTIYDQLTIPVEVVFNAENQFFVLNKFGVILTSDPATNELTTFLDISDRVNAFANEKGLLGLAFDPNYSDNGFFYVYYTDQDDSVLSRFERSSLISADPDSEHILLTQNQPFNNHNAGKIAFGPDDYLYVGFGDGGASGDPLDQSQNLNTWLGTILRLDVSQGDSYEVPEDNPFVGTVDTLPEIWASGLRNPWKFSFDQLTGDLYIADVGQNRWEEINHQPANSTGGENYGWRCYEGNELFNTSNCPNEEDEFTFPVHTYANNENIDGCSITGGYVYRGSLFPDLFGKYIYGDFCTGKTWALEQNGSNEWSNEFLFSVGPQELSSFGQDQNGEIYMVLLGSGLVQQLTPCSDESVTLSVQEDGVDATEGYEQYNWYVDDVLTKSGPEPFITDISTATAIYVEVLGGNACTMTSETLILNAVHDESFEKVTIQTTPNPFKDHIHLKVESFHFDKTGSFHIYDSTGKLFWSKNIDDLSSEVFIDTSDWMAGTYIIQWKSGGKIYSKSMIKQ